MKDEYKAALPHNLIVEGRENLSVSGVEGVVTSNEREVLMHTVMGDLVVLGEGLHIDSLSVETGDLHLSGRVDALQYREKTNVPTGLLARLFG